MKINLMAFIHNYQAKWLITDIALFIDIFANGVWGSEYYHFFEILGVKGGTVNAWISALQFVRVGILIYQGAIERQAQRAEACTLEHKENTGKD
jgi:hypothetical protein